MHSYVINLADADERWRFMQKQLDRIKIPYTRLEGILGKELTLPHHNYNESKYRILHGKKTNMGELGCFFSHIKALQTFLNSDASHAMILEDDIKLPANLIGLIQEALEYAQFWNLLRLTSFTRGEHLCFAKLSSGFSLSYNLKVLKNTGAYIVDRQGATCIVNKMLPMFLPYDVALDREWHYGFRTACISPLPILLNMDLPGQIPPARKIRIFRSTTFHLFHLLSHVERRFYRLKFYRETSRMIRRV